MLALKSTYYVGDSLMAPVRDSSFESGEWIKYPNWYCSHAPIMGIVFPPRPLTSLDGVVFDLGRAMAETCRPLLMAIGEDFAVSKQRKEEIAMKSFSL